MPLFGWMASKAKHKTEYPVDQLAGLYILHIFSYACQKFN